MRKIEALNIAGSPDPIPLGGEGQDYQNIEN